MPVAATGVREAVAKASSTESRTGTVATLRRVLKDDLPA
jgi:hypothetical protein